jgi:hypothetical protein
MNIDTWAVVLATAAGPIGAVLITFWRERRASLRSRRLQIFRTLMATRQIPISSEHVNSLNLIEVDFYGCKNVQKEWIAYKSHLFSLAPGVVEDDAWRDKRNVFLLTCFVKWRGHFDITFPLWTYLGAATPQEAGYTYKTD